MVYKKIGFSFLVLLSLSFSSIYSQVAIPATGGNGSGSGGTVSYTVGQVAYVTSTGSNGSVAPGVQQPYEISMVTSTVGTDEIQLGYSVFPNPSSDYVQLKIENYAFEKLNYQLIDLSGKLLETGAVKESETRISMKTFAHSTYFLKISDNKKVLKTFKIVKN